MPLFMMTGVFYLSDRNIILGGGQDFRNIYKAF
nr:MAG TPA: HindVP restriction endonuclease [Caudoviricetes sp.]